jgi:flagellar biogenesis protein FliO
VAYTLAAVLLVFSAYTLESKPESSKTARNKTQTEKAEKSAETRKITDAEKAGETQKTPEAESEKKTENPESKEINNSWMNTIHGGKALHSPDSSEEKPESDTSSALNPAASSAEIQAADRALFTPENQVEPPSFLSVIIRFILLMAALVGGLWFVARFIKQKQGIPLSGENTLLKVIVSLPLMPGKYLQVVELAGQIMVLGISEQGVRLVRNIEDGPTADRIRLWKDSHSSDSYDPVSLMDRFSSVLSAKDFQFWKHETKTHARSKAANTSFADLLSGDTYENQNTQRRTEDKGGDLNLLLSNQKRRLAALKKKGILPEEEDDQ